MQERVEPFFEYDIFWCGSKWMLIIILFLTSEFYQTKFSATNPYVNALAFNSAIIEFPETSSRCVARAPGLPSVESSHVDPDPDHKI